MNTPFPMPAVEERFLTMKQVGERIGVSDEQVRLWVEDGLPCLRLGKRLTRFVWAEVWEWIVRRGKDRRFVEEMAGGLHAEHWN